MRTKVLLCVLLAVALFTTGCDRLTSRGRSDTEIAQQVMSKIYGDANVPTKQITVQSNNGVVTLSGTVTSDMERTAAANDAAQVEGVKTVVNNLQVTSAANMMDQAATEEASVEEAPAPQRRAAAAPRRTARPRAATRASEPAPVDRTAPVPVETPVARATTPPAPQPITVPAGTTFSVRMVDSVDTAVNQAGDTFRATLDSPVMVEDKIVIPENADVVGRVADLRSAGHFTGQSQLALELSKVSFNGRTYTIVTDQYSKQGTSRGKRTAATVGGGAAVGAVLGGIIGGGKGAAIGAAAGAGAGTGVQAATKGQQVKVPSEAVLRFRLENPVTVTPASNAARQQLRKEAEYSDEQP